MRSRFERFNWSPLINLQRFGTSRDISGILVCDCGILDEMLSPGVSIEKELRPSAAPWIHRTLTCTVPSIA
jgi:hypothetical protein